MTLPKQITVKFNADIYPHVRGDVVVLTNADLKEIDEIAKKRDLEEPYTVIDTKKVAKGKADDLEATDVKVDETGKVTGEVDGKEVELTPADDETAEAVAEATSDDGDKADAGKSDEPAPEK